MKEQEIAKRWAQALFNLGHEESGWNEKVREFKTHLELIEAYPKLQKIFTSPSISKEDKEKILLKIFHGKVEEKYSRFLSLLIRKDRYKYLPEIARHYIKLVNNALSAHEMTLTTAVPLEEALAQQIREKVEKDLAIKTNFTTKVDPSIGGGVILTVDNRIFDASVKSKMEHLKHKLMKISL